MTSVLKLIFLPGLAAMTMWTMDFVPQTPYAVGFVPAAEARFGRPLTPVSVAGVARRTTRRAVVVTSTAAETETATVVETATTAPVANTVPIGTVVTVLPENCTATVIAGTQYQQCSGAYYRAAFQSNNLVYVVTQP